MNKEALFSLVSNTEGKSSKLKKELYGSQINVLENPISTIKFHQQYISQNKPCVIKNAIHHWKAMKKWNYEYLKEKINEKVIVDVTPNGYADALVEHQKKIYFTQPAKVEIEFKDFLEKLNTKNVYYLQHQNDNFRSNSFKKLFDDIEIPSWSNECFQNVPDAVNIWIGENRSVTSLHKDHYENIYAVIRGQKKFTLYPPTNYPLMYERKYPQAEYEMEGDDFHIKVSKDDGEIPWISVDPNNPDFEKFPNFEFATPYVVTLNTGDLLYLPSLWFHQVEQKVDKNGEMIAVNFWYDMEYGPLYNYYKFIEKLNFD
jgi:peptidyl-lysine (3S)-dioxygenase / protease